MSLTLGSRPPEPPNGSRTPKWLPNPHSDSDRPPLTPLPRRPFPDGPSPPQRTLNYLFGTGGIATSRLVEALSAGGSGPIYHGLLELSETESPKVRSGHGIDCFVLCRSDVPSYDRYLAEMVTGQPRFPASFDALSALTVKCWTTFAATGAPGELRGGVAWPPLPECMRLRSTGSATEPSEHAPNSDELKLWKRVCKEQHLPLGRFA